MDSRQFVCVSKATFLMDELTRSEEEDLLEERREEEGGEREIGALITYSEGFVCSYGQDSVFIFQQIIQNEEEIRQGLYCIRYKVYMLQTVVGNYRNYCIVLITFPTTPIRRIYVRYQDAEKQ